MNTEQIAAHVDGKIGSFQQIVGRSLGNQQLQNIGLHRQGLSKTKLALVEAREIIRLALKRQLLHI